MRNLITKFSLLLGLISLLGMGCGGDESTTEPISSVEGKGDISEKARQTIIDFCNNAWTEAQKQNCLKFHKPLLEEDDSTPEQDIVSPCVYNHADQDYRCSDSEDCSEFANYVPVPFQEGNEEFSCTAVGTAWKKMTCCMPK